jgi:hypothetical protein
MLLVFHLAYFLTEKFETSAQESGHHQPCKALQGWWLESTGFECATQSTRQEATTYAKVLRM